MHRVAGRCARRGGTQDHGGRRSGGNTGRGGLIVTGQARFSTVVAAIENAAADDVITATTDGVSTAGVFASSNATAGGAVTATELPSGPRARFYQDMKRVAHKAAEVANPKPLWADYIDDFEAMLRSERCVDDYLANVVCHVREVGDGCEFIRARNFDNARAVLRPRAAT